MTSPMHRATCLDPDRPPAAATPIECAPCAGYRACTGMLATVVPKRLLQSSRGSSPGQLKGLRGNPSSAKSSASRTILHSFVTDDPDNVDPVGGVPPLDRTPLSGCRSLVDVGRRLIPAEHVM